MAEVTSKEQMYNLQRQHKLGNCPETWSALHMVPQHVPYVYFRGMKRGMELVESVPLYMAPAELARYCSRNHCMSPDVMIGQAVIGRRIIQGELWVQGPTETTTEDDWHGLVMHYSLADVNHRRCAELGWGYARGLMAASLLEMHMTIDEREELSRLLNEYPGHIVEFSVFDKPQGWAYERLIVWECRMY